MCKTNIDSAIDQKYFFASFPSSEDETFKLPNNDEKSSVISDL